MTLPVVPGNSMSFSQINTELGLASTTLISLNQASVRTLAGVGASPATISITNLSGKANQFAFTISTNQSNANLRTLAVNAGWNQSSKVVATINAGVYVSASSTGSDGLTINGAWPGGVDLINNGFITGMGGVGGTGGQATFAGAPGNQGKRGSDGSPGGRALLVSSAVTITNNGTIGGGGGEGGGGTVSLSVYPGGECAVYNWRGGGGGGGGRTGATNSGGGAGGTTEVGGGSNGNAGSAGTNSGGGAGGAGKTSPGACGPAFSGAGGTGGTWGSSGAAGGTAASFTGFNQSGSAGGGGAGACISGNSNITYITTGTRLGSIS